MDESSVVALLRDLVSAESVNPAYPGPASGEAAAVQVVEAECRRLGLDFERQEVLPGRDNLIARLDIPRAHRTLLFETHTDTVSFDGMGDRATRPEVRDGRLYGRGSCDAKASVAAMVSALGQLAQRRAELGVNVWLVAAADEEYQFRGVLKYLERGDEISAGVVGEPTGLRTVIAHKGVVRFRITTRGIAAHSSAPDRGHNAIEDMATVIDALISAQRRLRLRQHPLLGFPTMSIGRIEGGTGVNIVPERCTIEVDRRFIPGETSDDVLREIDLALADLQGYPGLLVERETPFLVSPELDTPHDATIARAATEVLSSLHLATEPIGMAGGTDASKLWRLRHIPSIVLGPGSGAQAHSDNEYVELDQVHLATRMYTDLALAYSRMVAD